MCAYIAGNQIQDEGAKLLAEALKTSGGRLYSLNLNENSMGRDLVGSWFEPEQFEGINALAESLMVNTTLRILSLKDNNLGPISATALAAVIPHCVSVLICLIECN